jgi:NitT/TauT family transport system substrate-binding protein
VDAVTGFDLTVWFNLKAQGLKAEDVRILRFSEHGLAGYGNAVLAGQPLLRQNPEAVRRFVAVCNRAWREAARDPAPAIASLRRLSSLADPMLERERLEYVLQNHVLTGTARRDGIGAFDAARLSENIRVVVEGFGLPRTPAPGDIYDGSFVPPQAERMPA